MADLVTELRVVAEYEDNVSRRMHETREAAHVGFSGVKSEVASATPVIAGFDRKIEELEREIKALTFEEGRLVQQTKNVRSETKAAGEQSGKFFESIKSGLGIATGFAAVTAGISLVKAALVDTIQAANREFLEAENATAKLTAALRIQDQASIANVRALQNQADELARLTGVDDKAIQRAQAFAISLGQQTVPKTIEMTRAALNLSAALGTDLEAAMLAIVKASENGGAALGRLGIKFVATGDAAKDTDEILRVIEARLGSRFAETAIGPVQSKINELNSEIEENDQAIGKNINSTFNWKVGLLAARAALGDMIIAIHDFDRASVKADEDTRKFLEGLELIKRQKSNAIEIRAKSILEGPEEQVRRAAQQVPQFGPYGPRAPMGQEVGAQALAEDELRRKNSA